MKNTPSSLLLRFGLPIALVMAATVMARAYDTTWIADGETLSAAKLKADLDEIQQRLADAEKRLSGDPDCLPGYTVAIANNVTTCTKGNDVMVKVGKGPSAFWIDKYEASVWSDEAGTTGPIKDVPWGVSSDDYPTSFPTNGQRAPANVNFEDLFAVSRANVLPSVMMTWFQAQQACAASGKRLPTDEEWLRAASGTSDPGAVDGLAMGEKRCNTKSARKRPTGSGANCASAWGAEDTIGNVWEWTANWYAAPSWPGQPNYNSAVTWVRSEFNGDVIWNIASSTDDGQQFRVGHPAAAIRGGRWDYGTQSGVFAFAMFAAPSDQSTGIGFRCVAP